MGVIVPRQAFFRRRPAPGASRTVAPGAPVLVSAGYNFDDGAALVLVFDRAVTLAGGSADVFTLFHHPSQQMFSGTDGVLLDATTVKINMIYDDVCDPGDDAVMNAGA